MMTGSTGAGSCPHCGAQDVGGEEGCNRLFQEVVGREFERPELFRVHRMTVDAYSLQHPDRYMKSAKSAVAHLVGMCWAMEGEDDPAVSVTLSRFLDGTPEFRRPEPVPLPGERGGVTVAVVHAAASSADHILRVREWAASAWQAWSEHHGLAREWMKEARRRYHG